MVCASAGAFATTMIGVPSGEKVTETELATTAVTVKLPFAPGCAPAGAPEDKNSNTNARAFGIIDDREFFLIF